MTPSVINTVAGYVENSLSQPVPSEVVSRTKEIVLDTVGAIFAGTRLGPGLAILRYVASRREAPDVPIIGGGFRTSIPSAALANATLAHADEVDDSHFATLSHPASATVPVALALALESGCSGTEFLRAIVAGYDIQCRLSLAMDPRRLMRRGFMPLAICGHFGAAAVAAALLRMPAASVKDILGIVGCQTAGLWACATDPSHHTKALMAGGPARTGLEAALMVDQGFQGPPDIFEGPDGVLSAFSDEPTPSRLVRDLGTDFEIMKTSIKKHACGGPIRGPVDGLFQLMDAHNLTAEDISTIDVRLATTACAIVGDREDHAICLEHVMAVAAIDRFVGIHQTHSPERTEADDVLDLRRRVNLIPDDEFEKVWPIERPAVVELKTRDGRDYRIRIDEARGTPENPMTRDEVIAKFDQLTRDVLDESSRKTIVQQTFDLDKAESIEGFITTLENASHV